MGEFADMANERWADGDWEEDQEDEFPIGKRCRYCGREGLSWGFTDKGWRLHGRDPLTLHQTLHVCERK